MRKIIIGLLLLLSVGATAQWQQTGSKVRYVNGLGIPTKDTAAGVSADSSQIVIRPADSSLYVKYKRTWLRVGGGGGSIAGAGTLNRVAKFTSSNAIGNSLIYDNGTAVGINTLTPTTTLQVGDGTGNPEITASGLNYDVVLGTPAGSALGFTTVGNYVGVYSNSATKDLAFTHGNSRAITFGTGNQSRLTITSTGNVGIGTTSPGYKLEVNGVTGLNGNVAVLNANSLEIYSALNANYGTINSVSGNLQFSTNAGSERMRITSAGRVLLNTTTDNGVDQLQVAGSVDITSAAALLTLNSTATNQARKLYFRDAFGGASSESYVVSSTKLHFGAGGASRIDMTLTAGANLLINTTTDNGVDKLQANGSILSTQFKLSALNTAPASASSTGTLGEIRIDANYIYICTATNTWKRVAIATW